MYGAMRGFILVAIFWTASTERLTFKQGFGVGSLNKRDRHVCNAVQIESEFFITPAACLSGPVDPVEIQLIGTEDSPKGTPKAQCKVRKYQSHPKYIFLSHNIALMQVQCGQSLLEAQPTSFRDSKKGDRLILAGVNKSLRKVYTLLEVQRCFVCQKEYAAFDCGRQICLKPDGKIIRKMSPVVGLVGAGIFTPNATLVGVLSYGFANGSFVAERVIYYKQFLQTTMQEFASGQE